MRLVGSGLILIIVLDGRCRRFRLGDGVLVCYADAPAVWLQHDGCVREDVERRWWRCPLILRPLCERWRSGAERKVVVIIILMSGG